VVLARRSQTRGDEVLEATKNATRFRGTLPAEVMDILRWHADRLPEGPMQKSDLLFPPTSEGFGVRPCSTSRSRTYASASRSARR